jgi:aspartyl-tRNA(Asn)/glutamyl-tRNA(Gln) amidotransferase subunit B
VVQETRRFDAASGKTFSMRAKENADDYRYFPDPDLVPVVVSPELRQKLQDSLPMLPDQRKDEFQSRYGLSALAAEELVTRKDLADFFSAAAEGCPAPVVLANLVSGELARLCPEDQEIPVSPAHVAALAQLLQDGTINGGTCKKVLAQLVQEDQDPAELIAAQGLRQISDPAELLPLAQAVLSEQPKTLADYRAGNTNAFHALVGAMMKKTHGKGNPQVIHQVLEQLLGE